MALPAPGAIPPVGPNNPAKLSVPAAKVAAQEEWFVCPDWVGFPKEGTHLEVWKKRKLEETVMIDKSPYYIAGRNPGVADIVTEHPSLSRMHCTFVHHRKGNVYLIDLGSAAGTKLNGEAVPAKKTMLLSDGDEVTLGASTRVYKLRRSPPQKQKRAAAAAAEAEPAAKRARGGEKEEAAGAAAAAAAAPERVTAYHVLLKHNACRNPKSFRDKTAPVARSRDQARQQLEELKRSLSEKPDAERFEAFRTAAGELSDCATAKKGGALGVLKPGMMLKEVDAELFAMPAGTIRGPIESASGFHLVYRSK